MHAALALMLAVTPTLGPERAVDSPVVGLAGGDQGDPAVAFDGTQWLTVWTDSRSGVAEVWGSRVGLQQQVLDPLGIRISSAPASAPPAVAALGNGFLVVWKTEDGVLGVRVDAFGTVRDAAPLRISSATNRPFWDQVSVASSGSTALVCWVAAPGGSSCARVSDQGQVLDSTAIALDVGFLLPLTVDVSHDGTDFVVVRARREGTGPVALSRVSSAGVAVGNTTLSPAATTALLAPAVSCAAGTCLVVASRGSTLVALRHAGGVWLDDPPLVLGPSSSNSFRRAGQSAFFGGTFWVLWKDTVSGHLAVRSVPAVGAVAPAMPTLFTQGPAEINESALAAGPMGRALVAWGDAREGEDVYAAELAPPNVVPSAGLAISTGPSSQRVPRLAAVDGRGLLLWHDSRVPSGYRVTVLDGTVPAPGRSLRAGSPDESFDFAGAAGVAWLVDGAGATRVSGLGALLDAAPIDLGESAATVNRSVDCAVQGCFAVSQSRQADVVVGRSLGLDGGLGPTRTLSRSAGSWYPDVLMRPEGPLLAYHERSTGSNGRMLSLAIPPGGGAIDGGEREHARSSLARPRLATFRGGTLLAWLSGNTLGTSWLSPDGGLGDAGSFALPTLADDESLQLATAPNGVLAAWATNAGIPGVFIGQLTPQGGLEPALLFVDGGRAPALESLGAAFNVLAYERLDTSLAGPTGRVFFRELSSPCGSDLDCGGGTQCIAATCVLPVVDAGLPVVDAGLPDLDAGVPPADAGSNAGDGGLLPDAGSNVAGDGGAPVPPQAGPSGCGCTASGAGLWSAVLLLAHALRRRSSRER